MRCGADNPMDRRELMKVAGAAGTGSILGPMLPRGGRAAAGAGTGFKVRRLPGNPIIHAGMDARMREEAQRYGYVNINGPSLIRVPEWVTDPLGKYYLYFAHHKGEYIRMAYADDLGGPWRTYEPGVLELKDSYFPTRTPQRTNVVAAAADLWKHNPPEVAWALTRVGLSALKAVSARKAEGSYGSDENRPHLASPDVIIDEANREIRMYYHGLLQDLAQMTRLALSRDGLHFQARPELLTSPYLRVFGYRGMYYGIGMPGILYRSADGLSGFEARSGLLFGVNLRHTALMLRGSTLLIFFSRVGDAPERIWCSAMDVTPRDWKKWKPRPPVEVLRAEYEWEGAGLPVKPSIRGEITTAANQLRDPAIFEDKGKSWLLYACAGEQAIAIAEVEAGPGAELTFVPRG
jgi:hypothetical protein